MIQKKADKCNEENFIITKKIIKYTNLNYLQSLTRFILRELYFQVP